MDGVSVFFDAGAKQVLVRVAARRSLRERRYLGVIARDRHGGRLAAMFVQEPRAAAMAVFRQPASWDEGFEVALFALAGNAGVETLAAISYDPSLGFDREEPAGGALELSALAFGPLVDASSGERTIDGTLSVAREIVAPPGLSPALFGPGLREGFIRESGSKGFYPAIVRAARTADGGRRAGPCANFWPEANMPLKAACEAGLAWRPAGHGLGDDGEASGIEDRLRRNLAPTMFARLWIGSAADSEALAAGGVSRAPFRSAAKLFHLRVTAMRLARLLDENRNAPGKGSAFLAQSIDPYRADAPYARSLQPWREYSLDGLRIDRRGRLYAEARVAPIGLGDLFLLWIDPQRLRITGVSPDAAAQVPQPKGPPESEFWFVAAGQNLARGAAESGVFDDAAFAPFLAEVRARAARHQRIAAMRASWRPFMCAELARRLAGAADPAAAWAFGGYDEEESDLMSRDSLAQQARGRLAGRRHGRNGNGSGNGHGNGHGNGAAAPFEPPPSPAPFDAAPEIYLAGRLHGSLSEADLAAASRADAPLVHAILWPHGDCPEDVDRWLASLAPAEQARILAIYFDIHADEHSEREILSRLDQLRNRLEALAGGGPLPEAPAPDS